jgi:predicted Zn finger-like uncharacterized protein
MSHTIACPSCERTLRVPESLLGQQVKCPTCAHTFAAPDSIEEAPPRRPAPPPEEPRPRRAAPPPEADYEEPRPSRRRPRDDYEDDYEDAPRRRRRDEKPGKVQAIAIMTLIGGIFAVLIAVAWIATVIGLCWPGTYFALVAGIMAIIKGAQLMGEKAYRETPPSTAAILLIINIINGDVVNLALGIVILVFLGDREVKAYFRR